MPPVVMKSVRKIMAHLRVMFVQSFTIVLPNGAPFEQSCRCEAANTREKDMHSNNVCISLQHMQNQECIMTENKSAQVPI